MNTYITRACATLLLTMGCGDNTSSSDQSLTSEDTLDGPSDCARACLIDAAKHALAHVGDAADARITENGAVVQASEAWLTRVSDVHVHNAYADERRGQVMLVGSAQEPGRSEGTAAVFGMRAKIEQGKATEIELLTAHDGEASLFPAELPIETDTRYEDLVATEERDSAQTMIALANRYFDGIEASGDPDLPVDDGCNRVENGMQTTRNPRFGDLRCNSLEPFVYIPVVEQRRFPIVDEARGVVVAIVVFQIPGGDYELELNGEKVMRSYTPRALYLFEAFKVSHGRIQQIEATMRNLPYEAQIDWPAD